MCKPRISVLAGLVILFSVFNPSPISALPARAPAPNVTDIAPNQAYNYVATTITISGTDFVATPVVRLNNVTLSNTTWIDTTTLTATVPANLPGGLYTLSVTNPDAQNKNVSNAFTVGLSGNGNYTSWQSDTAMNTPRFCFSTVSAQSNLYAIGGFSDNTVYFRITTESTNGLAG